MVILTLVLPEDDDAVELSIEKPLSYEIN